ncbi:hypothetical protein LWI29_004255 [Acer saccharum]|uniref:Uncharacterized protein n=1 Tax=Acer saccharum TaxID=4024 RepID=A0AA39VMK0_ACESA|nr:hypothetical protein LWI29_004255 [Acer saccharum]
MPCHHQDINHHFVVRTLSTISKDNFWRSDLLPCLGSRSGPSTEQSDSASAFILLLTLHIQYLILVGV